MLLRMLGSIPAPPSNGLHLGPVLVHAYGLAYVVAVLAAIAITTKRWEARGGSRELVFEVALWGFPAGLIGGRLYFLATSWNEVPAHWWGPLAIWRGGLGIWGGIALGTLGGLLVLRRRGASIACFMDAAAPGLLVAQAIGRIGNYFNQELFGRPTSLPWALQIDPAHRPAGYAQYATFQPIFLYELIWDLALAVALIRLGRLRRVRAPGLFALYVAGYSGFRIFEELLRVDPAHHIFGLRLNFFVASLLTAFGLVWFARIQHGRGRAGRRVFGGGPAALGIAPLLCALAGCGHGGAGRADRTVEAAARTTRALPTARVELGGSPGARGRRSRAPSPAYRPMPPRGWSRIGPPDEMARISTRFDPAWKAPSRTTAEKNSAPPHPRWYGRGDARGHGAVDRLHRQSPHRARLPPPAGRRRLHRDRGGRDPPRTRGRGLGDRPARKPD
jgi:prolipoprotein diacylglyceryl transferase